MSKWQHEMFWNKYTTIYLLGRLLFWEITGLKEKFS